MESFDLAQLVAKIAEDKLGKDILIKDLSEVSVLCDYFVIVSAPTRLQTRDIAHAIEGDLAKQNIPTKRIQGMREGSWILMDYGNVVVHVFLQAERDFYDLEGLWRQAPGVAMGASK